MATRRRAGRILTKKAIQFEGIDQIVRNANALARAGGYGNADIAQEYKRSLITAALMVRDEARALVPVDTGLLRNSIFAAYGDPKKSDVIVGVNTRMAVSTSGGETRTYAGVIEYGNDEHPPQPYMRPAVTSTRPLIARVLKEKMTGAVEKLAHRLAK